ncbi:SDR family oxidoreductase [Methylomonas sp. UP202]|uniref:SDR family oxidoreductase n=1 Tax=Methylomonas sp. UP202 TaxID=3040943 RepID=UPI00247B2777|nr:SDR family oxidoreductase [Methylomonas sp. UP202]WGS88162.1 SDR family oxidoreductase [Methylomonas sp. UP202]
MQTVLITGANRGLGLEFCRQYSAAGWWVLAVCRCPDDAEALLTLAADSDRVKVLAADIADFGQIDALAAELRGTPIDVLLNNAGVYGDRSGHGFGNLDYSTWLDTLTINTLAPVKLAEALLPNLQAGQRKLIVTVSSLMGSMTDNTSGGSILYRSSKAGVNAAMKSLSIDLAPQGIGVLILHPGWVRTDMGGPNALIDAHESVSGMINVIDGYTPAQSGSFLRFGDGKVMPW